jgi:hypothetical protein
MIRFTPKYKHQVFLCHAFEDQRDFADGLDKRLRERRVNVWYSARNMPIGDSLETIVEKIIPSCRHGIVIISNDYFGAGWARRELDVLYNFERIRSHKIILPIWHGVDEHEVKEQFPYLVDRFAARSDKGIDYVVDKIIKEIKPPPSWWLLVRLLGTSLYNVLIGYWMLLLFALAISAGVIYHNKIAIWLWSDEVYRQEIERRIAGINQLASAEYDNRIRGRRQVPANLSIVGKFLTAFGSLDNVPKIPAYHFNDAIKAVTGKRQLEQAGINVKDRYKAYGMGSCSVCVDTSPNRFSYSLLNTEPVNYTILNIKETEYQAVVKVQYEQGIRCVIGTITKPETEDDRIREETWFYGLSPVEEYVFERKQNHWEFITKR